VRNLQIDYGQGYYFARPAPAEDHLASKRVLIEVPERVTASQPATTAVEAG
jgi:EAL domain-containing protein (putative c-di-GMP-specific phosphodiesterase class I)